jgi:two-component system OmpR family response regulator
LYKLGRTTEPLSITERVWIDDFSENSLNMRVLVVEDETDMARYLCDGLRLAGFEVTHCTDAPMGLFQAEHAKWDVMIVDRMLPDEQDGLQIIRTLRNNQNKTPVLVLSALASLDERVKGLREGGDDYLTKPFAFPELLARLEALTRRSVTDLSLTARSLQIANLSINLTTRRVERAGQVINLQPREFRLLEYLARNQDQVVTRTMLLESVWDFHFDPGTNVIDVQISRLRTKIDKGHTIPLLHTVRGVGYKFGING